MPAPRSCARNTWWRFAGAWRARQKPNPELASGEVEVFAAELRILNTAKTPPFVVEDEVNASEETRLHYRYLDLRRPRPQRNLALRHRVVLEIRKTMDALGFYEIETPMLTRSTPEGARDYLVPSRVHHGQFYALPQSPQIFKQILMIGGLDRYFQIARCFRDEDLRADRQPEFTQLDLEMSFPRQQDIFGVIEQVMVRACAVAGIKVNAPFRHMEYREAIRRYGIDKPDLRFGMELRDVTPHFAAAREKLRIEGNVQALVAPGAAAYSRKQLDELAEQAKALGARGLYTMKVTAEGAASALDKTLGAAGVQAIVAATGAKPGDLIVAVSAAEQIPGTDAAALIAGQLRLALAERLNLIPKDRWEFLWITGFPLFEWSASEKTWAPAQHPFTGIVEEDLDKIESEPQERALQGLRPGAQRRRAGLRQHPDSQPGAAGARISDAGLERGAAARALRIFPRRADLRHAAAWRHRAGHRPHDRAAGRRKIDARSDRLPEDHRRAGPDGRFAVAGRSRPARRSGHRESLRRRARRGH